MAVSALCVWRGSTILLILCWVFRRQCSLVHFRPVVCDVTANTARSCCPVLLTCACTFNFLIPFLLYYCYIICLSVSSIEDRQTSWGGHRAPSWCVSFVCGRYLGSEKHQSGLFTTDIKSCLASRHLQSEQPEANNLVCKKLRKVLPITGHEGPEGD